MANLVLIENDIRDLIMREAKPKGITIKKAVPCKCVAIVDDKVARAVDMPRVQAKLTEAAGEVYKKVVAKIIKDLKVFDKLYMRTPDPDDRLKIIFKLEGSIKRQLALLEKGGVKAASAAWSELQKDHEELFEYKLKTGMAIAKDAFELGGIAVSIASTGGIAAIPACLELARVVFRLGRVVAKLARDADKTQKSITKNLEKLQKSYNKNKKIKIGPKETAKSVLNILLGSDYTKTIKSVDDDNVLYLNKLRDIDKKADSLSGTANMLLKKVKSISSTPQAKSSAKAKKKIEEIEKKINKLLVKIVSMSEKVNDGKSFQKNTDLALKELENQKPEKWKKIQAGANFVASVVLAVEDPTELSDWFEAAVGEMGSLIEEETGRMNMAVA